MLKNTQIDPPDESALRSNHVFIFIMASHSSLAYLRSFESTIFLEITYHSPLIRKFKEDDYIIIT